MPALAKASGQTSSEAVFVVSISGGVDAVGRIVAGFLLDRPVFSKCRLVVYSCAQFLLAGICALMPVFGGSFLWLCVASCVFGVLSGILAAQKSVVCVDLLGAERISSAFGMLLLFQAVGIGIGPLLSGKNPEITYSHRKKQGYSIVSF
ncbi:monocarboxylate transporter 4 [Elysia marginata]|uniref:Monocarboxylate transporter 4 n=1 Tax=Elysia marginata TaxID=1093978 RepID=A0AAV4I672_9GAST|nr:monocarboxylate transporter 4 [Elysia marginata]